MTESESVEGEFYLVNPKSRKDMRDYYKYLLNELSYVLTEGNRGIETVYHGGIELKKEKPEKLGLYSEIVICLSEIIKNPNAMSLDSLQHQVATCLLNRRPEERLTIGDCTIEERPYKRNVFDELIDKLIKTTADVAGEEAKDERRNVSVRIIQAFGNLYEDLIMLRRGEKKEDKVPIICTCENREAYFPYVPKGESTKRQGVTISLCSSGMLVSLIDEERYFGMLQLGCSSSGGATRAYVYVHYANEKFRNLSVVCEPELCRELIGWPFGGLLIHYKAGAQYMSPELSELFRNGPTGDFGSQSSIKELLDHYLNKKLGRREKILIMTTLREWVLSHVSKFRYTNWSLRFISANQNLMDSLYVLRAESDEIIKDLIGKYKFPEAGYFSVKLVDDYIMPCLNSLSERISRGRPTVFSRSDEKDYSYILPCGMECEIGGVLFHPCMVTYMAVGMNKNIKLRSSCHSSGLSKFRFVCTSGPDSNIDLGENRSFCTGCKREYEAPHFARLCGWKCYKLSDSLRAYESLYTDQFERVNKPEDGMMVDYRTPEIRHQRNIEYSNRQAGRVGLRYINDIDKEAIMKINERIEEENSVGSAISVTDLTEIVDVGKLMCKCPEDSICRCDLK